MAFAFAVYKLILTQGDLCVEYEFRRITCCAAAALAILFL
jgi:hypothetical protein